MIAHVSLQVAFLRKSFLANLTHIRFYLSVLVQMLEQLRVLHVAFGALGTLERLFFPMDTHMSVQVSLADESFLAYIALDIPEVVYMYFTMEQDLVDEIKGLTAAFEEATVLPRGNFVD